MKRYQQADDGIGVDDACCGSERGRHEHYVVDCYIRAVDRATKHPLGEVRNITLADMQLTRTEPIAANQVFECTLDAALESGRRIFVPLICRSVWCRRQEFGCDFDASFEFIDPSLQLEEQILELLAELS